MLKLAMVQPVDQAQPVLVLMVALILADRVQLVEPELLQGQPVLVNLLQAEDLAVMQILYQMQRKRQVAVVAAFICLTLAKR